MFILNEVNSIAHHFLYELRDVHIQKDPMRFRRNMERLGEILAYEVSKTLLYEENKTITPLGEVRIPLILEQPVLISVLRAGLPFFQGFLNYFDRAESGFIGAYRNPHDAKNNFDIVLNYIAAPEIQNKTVILIDPMLATGSSLVKAVRELVANGKPKIMHIISAISSPEGIKYLEENIQIPFTIWTGAIDEKLNKKSYIIPGLGDAGDLSYGSKI
ncbi:MAG: uracil phosphoribosyltransferase [Bacteroidota bacterium]|jgi:uracil phosphoribosyltransferase|nr:uracil phosphoribosyltransferase [Bacteroidota bacterium]